MRAHVTDRVVAAFVILGRTDGRGDTCTHVPPMPSHVAGPGDDVEQVLAALKACDLDALLSVVHAAVAKREQLLELQATVGASTTGGEVELVGSSLADNTLGAAVSSTKAVMEDLVDQLERTQQVVNDESSAVPGVRLSTTVKKHQRQYMWGLAWDAILELTNTVGDVLFFLLVLPKYPHLYWWSFAALVLSLVGRLFIALQSCHRVDQHKRGWYFIGTMIMLVEPMTGTRVLRRSFRQDDASGGVDAGGGVVRKDARAIAATNEWHASKAEIFNSILLVMLEDVNALIIETWFLVLAQEDVSPVFYLTAGGTLMHMARQLSEILALRAGLPHLEEIMAHRDVAFGEEDTDEQLISFAQRSALACRRFDARLCSGNISDSAVETVAQHCLALDSLDLGTNQGVGTVRLTRSALATIGQNCTVLTKLFLTDCDWVTDAGVVAIAEGCPVLTRLSLRKSFKVSDPGIVALGQHCHLLVFLMLNDTQIGDDGVRALVAGCRGLRTLFACGTKVTEECLHPLSELKHLTSCWLKRNSIPAQGVGATELCHRRPRLDLRID